MLMLYARIRRVWEQISRGIGSIALLPVGLLISGCTTLGNDFIVDVEPPDPLIYSPGSAPGKPLWIPLNGFALSCDEEIPMTVRHGTNDPVSFMLANRVWAYEAPFRKVVVAKLEADVAKKLADGALTGSFDTLASSFEQATSNQNCTLAFDHLSDAGVAARAAHIVVSRLPRKYSAMLRSAYNHRVWPQSGNDTQGISVDLFAGMRLRIENSVPISPQGAGSRDTHPSSFAGPTYLYFHSFTGAELCDPHANPGIDNPNRCKGGDKDSWDRTTFLSPNGGLARLGLVQKSGATSATVSSRKLPPPMKPPAPVLPLKFTATYLATSVLVPPASSDGPPPNSQPVTTKVDVTFTQAIAPPSRVPDMNDVAVPVSSLIDLLEWGSVGQGAQRYWRLWLPGYRSTTSSTPVSNDNGGSSEAPESTPLLFSADKLEDLPSTRLLSGTEPCAIPEGVKVNWTCYRLHYRVVPVPEIAIWVNGTREWVAIGTTLRDVAADRLHGGSTGRPNHFSTNASLATLAEEAPSMTAARLARNVAASVRLTRLYEDGPHPVNAHSLANATDVARFMRLQLMPGDEITWQK